MNFIIDKEINLRPDSGQAKDALNTATYAERLIDCIEKAPENRSFTIGLFGEWGCGKSSVIKTIQESYPAKAKNSNKNVLVINYDAWKYSDDSFRRMFLLELQQQLGVKPTDKMQRFYDNINEDTQIKHETNNNYIYLIIAVLFVLTLLYIFGNAVSAEWKLSLATFITMATLIMSLKKNSTDDLKVTVQKSRLFAPEQFEDCFDDLLQAAFRQHTTPEKILSWVKKEGYDIDLDQLVIVIDNIDRCQSNVAYKLLTDIKNFLGKDKNVVFVVPVDVDALRKHILNSSKLSKDELNQDADEFLRKFFNVSIWMKPFRTDEIFEFASKLNADNQLQFNETTLNLVSKQFATNPRRIIQLFNNLSVELQGYDEAMRSEDQSLIAKVQIIKEEFPEFYQMALNEPILLHKDYKTILSKPAPSENPRTPDETLVKDNRRLYIFLTNTLAVTTPYADQEGKLTKVLSNSITFDGLPQGLTDAIDIDDYVSIKALEGLTKYKQQLIKYLNLQLQKSIQRKLYQTDVLTYLNLYLDLYVDNQLNNHQHRELMNIIGNEETLSTIVANIPQLDRLIDFGVHLESLHLMKLSQSIVEYLKISEDKQVSKLSDKQRKAILHGCSVWNKTHVKQLVKEFAQAYTENPIEAQGYDYKNNYSIIITDELVEEKIGLIEKDSMLEPSSAYQTVRYFSEHRKFSESLFNKFALKVSELGIHYEWKSNNSTPLLPYIKEIYPVIGNCAYGLKLSDTTAISKLWTVLSGKATVSGRGERSLILDNVGARDVIDNVIELFYTITSISNKAIISQSEITQIMKQDTNQYLLLTKLYDLHKNGFDISYYFDALSATTQFSNEHIEMLEKAFMCQDVNVVSNAKKISELSRLLNIIVAGTNERCRAISGMIDRLTENSDLADIFEVVLKDKSTGELAKLSPKLQRFAVARFVEDIETYKDDEQVLTSIATFGKSTEISIIVPVINTKLVNSNTLPSSALDMTARVILSLKSLRQQEIESVKANLSTVPENKLPKDKIEECIKYVQSLSK